MSPEENAKQWEENQEMPPGPIELVPNTQPQEHSAEITNIVQALCEAQKTIQHAKKGKFNPFTESKYCDLADVMDACRDQLTTNGICFTQLPSVSDNIMSITTLLMHKSGEWIRSVISCNPVVNKKSNNAQSMKAAFTYLRRIALESMVGVASEDDDGNNSEQVDSERIRKCLESFKAMKVTEAQIEDYLEHPLEMITAEEIGILGTAYRRMDKGESWKKVTGSVKKTERQKAVERAKLLKIDVGDKMKVSDINELCYKMEQENKTAAKPKPEPEQKPAAEKKETPTDTPPEEGGLLPGEELPPEVEDPTFL